MDAILSGIAAIATDGDGEDEWLSITTNHLAAIRLCLSNQLHTPALVLIYCVIDFMGFLSRPQNSDRANKNDFVRWAELKMDCQQRLGVSGLDLYAARCGMVHAQSMDSTLSKKGPACRILYAWGDAQIEEPTQVLQALGLPEKFVKIEALFDAFKDSIAAFQEELERDPNFKSLVLKRSRESFADYPFFPTDKNRHLWE